MREQQAVYLAGPIKEVDDNGRQWRNEVVNEFGDYFEFNNPLDEYDADGYGEDLSSEEIVELDKSLLRKSNAVLVGYSDVQSIGTPMEVMWAYEREMPIVMWIIDDTESQELSSWYRHHVDAFGTSLNEALIDLEVLVDEDTWMWWS